MEGIISFLTPHDDSRMFLWLILVVFLVGAGLGVFKFFAFYLNLTEFVDAYKNNKHGVAEEDPETYLTRATGIESTSRILSPFPSVLVTVGILGTFIGIGMAIAEAITNLCAAPVAALADIRNGIVQYCLAQAATHSFNFR